MYYTYRHSRPCILLPPIVCHCGLAPECHDDAWEVFVQRGVLESVPDGLHIVPVSWATCLLQACCNC
jgi:hypothetical protein